jgi:uncharacterized protein with GYD domain
MSTFLILFRFTQPGIQNIKDSPARVQQAKDDFEAVGAHVKAFYGLMGRYDTMFIAEAPDDETVMRATIEVVARGFVSSETLRAFTEEEFSKLVGGL